MWLIFTVYFVVALKAELKVRRAAADDNIKAGKIHFLQLKQTCSWLNIKTLEIIYIAANSNNKAGKFLFLVLQNKIIKSFEIELFKAHLSNLKQLSSFQLKTCLMFKLNSICLYLNREKKLLSNNISRFCLSLPSCKPGSTLN